MSVWDNTVNDTLPRAFLIFCIWVYIIFRLNILALLYLRSGCGVVKCASARDAVDTDGVRYSVLVDLEKLGPTLMIMYGPSQRSRSLSSFPTPGVLQPL